MKIGETFAGKVVGIKPYGVFVELENGHTGLVHISEIKSGFIEDINSILKLEQAVQVQVIDIDDYSQKASLSMRTLEKESHHHGHRHRFSNSRYTYGFKPLGASMKTWIREGKAYLEERKQAK